MKFYKLRICVDLALPGWNFHSSKSLIGRANKCGDGRGGGAIAQLTSIMDFSEYHDKIT